MSHIFCLTRRTGGSRPVATAMLPQISRLSGLSGFSGLTAYPLHPEWILGNNTDNSKQLKNGRFATASRTGNVVRLRDDRSRVVDPLLKLFPGKSQYSPISSEFCARRSGKRHSCRFILFCYPEKRRECRFPNLATCFPLRTLRETILPACRFLYGIRATHPTANHLNAFLLSDYLLCLPFIG